MSLYEEAKRYKKNDPKKFKTKFLAELEQLKLDPLYFKALEEVEKLEKQKKDMKRYEISFSIPYSTVFGEKMAVVGSHEALGNWTPSRAFEMHWTEGNVWKCNMEIDAGPQEIYYKYICINGSLVKWENSENRLIAFYQGEKVGNKVKINIQDYWRG
jgi:Starch binding domain